MTYQRIEEFYAGRSVLVTGATGFVGKVLVEKLLYSCQDIAAIYVLVRDKKDVTAKLRMETIFNLPLFDRLRKSRADAFNKVVCINGDIMKPDLGISAAVSKDLFQKISVVFHVAASVRFKDNLRSLLESNTFGTQRVIQFCNKIKRLEVFVYVSTAYSQNQDKVIQEKIYPQQVNIKEIESIVNQYDENPQMYKDLLNGRLNTYTLTKALSENVVAEAFSKNQLPAVIVRPSIIAASYKSPPPGWQDTWGGATGLIYSLAKGFSHVIYGKGSYIVDLIPVDYVVNAMIVAAARYTKNQRNPSVYNICTSSGNPLTISDLVRSFGKFARSSRFNELPVGVVITSCTLLYHLIRIITELFPSIFIDFWEKARGRKPWYAQVNQLMGRQREVLNAYSNGSWVMETSRTESLASNLSTEDQEDFEFDPKKIIWDEYIGVYLAGIERFLLPSVKDNC